ncbi:hypothetical protein [Streptomyces megasporus]|nr:hypothetical protein [Streptomyces megasporus]
MSVVRVEMVHDARHRVFARLTERAQGQTPDGAVPSPLPVW